MLTLIFTEVNIKTENPIEIHNDNHQNMAEKYILVVESILSRLTDSVN